MSEQGAETTPKEEGAQAAPRPPLDQRPKRRLWETAVLLAVIIIMFGLDLIKDYSPALRIPYLARNGGVFLLNMVALTFAFALIGYGMIGRWSGVIDSRNQISLSRLQLVMWSIMILSAFITIATFHIRTGNADKALDFTVPAQVWGLLGISTVSLAGAGIIKSQKKDADTNEEALDKTAEILVKQDPSLEGKVDNQGALLTYASPKYARFSDIFTGDEVGSTSRKLWVRFCHCP